MLLIPSRIAAEEKSAMKSISFRYDDGAPTGAGDMKAHQATLPPLTGSVWIYAGFGPTETNPVRLAGGQPIGLQTVTFGMSEGETFTPVVSFGMAGDTHAGMNDFGMLIPWAHDRNYDYYGKYARPQTPYDFKIKLDLKRGTQSVWVSGRGDDDWFLLANDAPAIDNTDKVNMVRVEQNLGAAGVDLVIRATSWPEGEKVRPYSRAKADRLVAAGKGFTFQSMKSIWQKPDRHVTIARNNPNTTAEERAWLGFPDVAQIGPRTLVCAYDLGAAHGGSGPVEVARSEDLGATWRKVGTIDCPSAAVRLQLLKDRSLLMSEPGFYRSTDEGRTWERIGQLNAKEAGGHEAAVVSRVVEMPDGAWLVAGSWSTFPDQDFWNLNKSETVEVYRSTDRGKTWRYLSSVDEYPRGLSEPSMVLMPTGRLWMFIRESFLLMPGVKTFSDDGGKTWASCEELPFPIIGRTNAGCLHDGRVFMTMRESMGRSSLWAWVGDPAEKTINGIWAAHLNDSRSVAMKNGALYIDNDGRRGQFTQYFLSYPHGPDGTIEVTAEVKVPVNNGYAATLIVPYVGKMRIYPDHIQFAHDASLKANITPGRFHAYRLIADEGSMKLSIDGKEVLSTDKCDNRIARTVGTIVRNSPYVFGFGNEPTFPMYFEYSDVWAQSCLDEWEHSGDEPPAQLPTIPKMMMITQGIRGDQVTPRVTGCSIWKRVNVRLGDPKTGVREQSWDGKRDGFPDQYLLDRVFEVEASTTGSHGLDQGYASWIELADGRLFVVNYTDDTAPPCRVTPSWPTGLPWIRGTYVLPEDLPKSPR